MQRCVCFFVFIVSKLQFIFCSFYVQKMLRIPHKNLACYHCDKHKKCCQKIKNQFCFAKMQIKIHCQCTKDDIITAYLSFVSCFFNTWNSSSNELFSSRTGYSKEYSPTFSPHLFCDEMVISLLHIFTDLSVKVLSSPFTTTTQPLCKWFLQRRSCLPRWHIQWKHH